VSLAGVQLPHSWSAGTVIEPHVHWRKKTAGAGKVLWRFGYEFASVGGLFSGSLTTIDEDDPIVASGEDGSALRHLVTSFGSIAMVGHTVSCIGSLTLSRIGGDGADTFAGVATLLSFDIHILKDTLGSDSAYTKTAVSV
jgi:hypothetical protein